MGFSGFQIVLHPSLASPNLRGGDPPLGHFLGHFLLIGHFGLPVSGVQSEGESVDGDGEGEWQAPVSK